MPSILSMKSVLLALLFGAVVTMEGKVATASFLIVLVSVLGAVLWIVRVIPQASVLACILLWLTLIV